MDRWSSLSNALVFEILLQVPVVDILPKRLVCKEWHPMISSHEFAEKQRTCGATRSQLSLLVMSCAHWHNSKYSFLYHHASWNFSQKPTKRHCRKMKLDFLSCRNPLSDYDHLFIKSSCNGLVLAYDVNDAKNITNPYPNREAGEVTRLALPKVYFKQSCCKLYEANGRLRFLGPPSANERIQMWETQNWSKMSNWYPIILIDCKPTLFLDYWNLSNGYSTCIIADYFAGERRELYHEMVQWMNSLASTFYIAAMFVHFDSLVSRV
ncbi:hypothetical protein Droror1_Dr00011200 [Drosera rotundifolia]